MLIWVIWVPLTFNKAGPWPGVYRRGFNVLWCQHHYYSRPFHSLPGGSRHYDLMSQAAVITPDYAHFVADICVGSYCIVSMIFICLSTCVFQFWWQWLCVFRFCLFVFTLFTIIATVAVLLSAPHIIVQWADCTGRRAVPSDMHGLYTKGHCPHERTNLRSRPFM